jgi:K+-sensing histidine kinase KdpD
MEADKFTLNDEIFAPNDAVTECLEVMDYQFKKKKLELKKVIRCDPTLEVKNDKTRYKQIIFNLLGNSLKFTTEGHVDVELNYQEENHTLVTTVSDTGCGIKPEEQASLFQVYGKMESHKKNNPHGVGFGLNICKKLSEAMGGRIACESEYCKGTRFSFVVLNKNGLNLGDSPNVELSVSHAAMTSHFEACTSIFVHNKSSRRLNRKILAVDDEPICGYVMLNLIKALKYDVDLVYLY